MTADESATVTQPTAEPSPLPQLRFRLPGEWWQIPLHSSEEAIVSIRRLIDKQVGNADAHATLRSQLRRQFAAAAAIAIEGDGQSLQIALSIVEELPVPVSFTVFLPQLRMTPAVGTSPAAVIAVLQQGLAETTGPEWATLHRFATATSEVLRTHRRQLVAGYESADAEESVPTLSVDYWMTIPGSKLVVLVNFSTVLADIDDVMLTLFDSIMSATYWDAP